MSIDYGVPFIGRDFPLSQLNNLTQKRTASLVVIKGRRRVGKSRLAHEFAKNKKLIKFVGLPPDKKVTAQDQRDTFARVLSKTFGIPGLRANDWSDLFTLLSNQTKKDSIVILLDELSWMGSKDHTFLGKLKTAWDEEFKLNSRLIMILCSSVSPWMEKNVLSSTGFHGRISLKITLDQLSLYNCNKLMDAIGFRGSDYEKLLLLSITGGIPWYIELINPSLTATENIKNLCFIPDGILVDEFNQIFHDLYGRRGPICKKIVELLAKGPARYDEIATRLGYASGGPLTKYLDSLEQSAFVKKEVSWSLKTDKETRDARYRLADNYLRYYLKFIEPNHKKIQMGKFSSISVTSLPGFDVVMGLQFENLVLSNRNLILEKIGVKEEELIFDNPYVQKSSADSQGCQIDYLIQTRLGSIFVCEIRFTRNAIKPLVITQVKEKITRLKTPKKYKCIPVLIYFGSLNQKIVNENYFFKLIDFSEWLS